MESKVFYTDEVDDTEEVVQIIFDEFEDFALKKNSLGIIFMEEDVEYLEIYQGLSERWKFPIIGCTATAMLASSDGYDSDGMTIMLMTADDCEFVAGVTGELDRDNYKDSISELYSGLHSQLGEEEKLVISYGVCVTAKNHVAADDLLAATDEVCGHKPIVGGLAADRFNFADTRVFCNDKLIKNGLVMALVSGHIKPRYYHVTSMENSFSRQSYLITKSDHNEVMCLDGEPMKDVLERENFEVSKTDVLREYLLTPFIVTVPQPGGGEIRAARNLSLINQENKSGIFLGAMPEGATLQVGMVDREIVRETVDEVTDAMLADIKDDEYTYSTMIVTSCAARYLALASQIEDAAAGWVASLPKDLTMIGMYSNGEFCPVTDEKTGTDHNTFHNFTFCMLVI